MATQISTGFKVASNNPIDDRFVFDTIAQRDSLPTSRRTVGLITFIRETNCFYRLENDISNTGWKQCTFGGSGNLDWAILE